MLDKMNGRDEETNEFLSGLLNVSDIDNLVLFNVNEHHNSINNDCTKITEEDSYSLWLLLNEWNLGYLHKTCIGKKKKLSLISILVNITNLKMFRFNDRLGMFEIYYTFSM